MYPVSLMDFSQAWTHAVFANRVGLSSQPHYLGERIESWLLMLASRSSQALDLWALLLKVGEVGVCVSE